MVSRKHSDPSTRHCTPKVAGWGRSLYEVIITGGPVWDGQVTRSLKIDVRPGSEGPREPRCLHITGMICTGSEMGPHPPSQHQLIHNRRSLDESWEIRMF
jgi:hypothetical protein